MLKILNNLRNVARPLLIQTRAYPGMKHDLYDHIDWKRPPKIPHTEPVKSGDLAPLQFPEKDELILEFKADNAQLLNSISDLTKRVLSVEMNPRKYAVQMAVDDMVDKVKRHEGDWGSMESTCKELSLIKLIQLIKSLFSGKDDCKNSCWTGCSRARSQEQKDEAKA